MPSAKQESMAVHCSFSFPLVRSFTSLHAHGCVARLARADRCLIGTSHLAKQVLPRVAELQEMPVKCEDLFLASGRQLLAHTCTTTHREASLDVDACHLLAWKHVLSIPASEAKRRARSVTVS